MNDSELMMCDLSQAYPIDSNTWNIPRTLGSHTWWVTTTSTQLNRVQVRLKELQQQSISKPGLRACEYQDAVRRTMDVGAAEAEALAHYSMGLAGEVGEVLEPLKKYLYRHDRPDLDRKMVGDELGDVAWYLTALCETLGLSLAVVLESNIHKLKLRYPDGWPTSTDSSGACPG